MTVFIDYDTTLVNLIDPWVEWINKKYNVTISSNDINRWYYLGEVFGSEANNFWKSEEYNHYTDREIFQPYEGAVEFFHTLQDMFGRENVFIISSTKDHHKKEKIEHAKHYFSISNDQFIAVEKGKYTLTSGGVLIDDYPLHVMDHIEYNKHKGIVFNFEDRFGWCKESNYPLDSTLTGFIHTVEDDNFSIATSYMQIIEELNYGRNY